MSEAKDVRRRGIADYPLAEKCPETVLTARGKPLNDITLGAVEAGDVTLADLRITPNALLEQAQISEDAGRATLARNFERAAELVDVPQELIFEIYEMLRPGRARDKAVLLAAASKLRASYGAQRMADFLEEAADVYERRGLFSYRF